MSKEQTLSEIIESLKIEKDRAYVGDIMITSLEEAFIEKLARQMGPQLFQDIIVRRAEAYLRFGYQHPGNLDHMRRGFWGEGLYNKFFGKEKCK